MLSNCFWRFLAILVVLAGPVNPGFAAEGFPSLDIPLQLTVDTVVDSNEPALQACVLSVPGDCSLRGAISRANAFPGLAVNISLPGGLYVLDLSGSDDANQSGDLDLAGQVSLSGAGREMTVISANRLDRVLDIQPGAVAALSDLTLRDGLAGPDESGGGVRNRGTLELARLAITANQAGDARLAAPPANPARTGGSGGGIFNSGSLSLHDSLVTENAGGRGADLPKPANYASCAAGAGGSGGGIYNAGWLEITNSRVVQNQAGAGGNGPACIWFCDYPGGNVYPGGTGGAGGGVYNAGTLLGSALLVQQNQAGLGGDGGFDLVWSSPGGAGGNGGGVFNSGWLQVSNSRLEDNVGGEGGLSGFGMISYVEAGPGDRGSGGGFYNHGQATLRETAVLGNRLLGGIVGYFYRLAHGGGIYNAAAGRLEIDSCRLNGNFASGLGGGLANYGSLTLTGGEISQNNALDSGGGLFNLGSLVLSQALIYENFTGPGYPGLQRVYRYHSDPPTNGWSPSGGGIFNAGIARFDAIQVINNRAGDGGHGGNSGDYYPAADGGAGGSGGGIANSGALEINYSVVQGNQAGRGGERGYNYSTWGDGLDGSGGGGGGIFNWGKLTGAFVDLRENLAGAGFSETKPGGDGGGLASLAGQGEFQWRDSRVSGNATQAGGKGGGLFLDGVSDPNGKYVLTNSQVISNTAGADGGGLYLTHSDIEVANLVIAANQAGAGFSGSGIFLADHNLAAAGLTIAANIGGDGSGVRLAAGTMALNNTIVAGQQVGVSLAEGTTARLTATLWGAGGWANGVDWAGSGELIPGMDDFSADPRFLAPQAGDFHLSADSPAIDVGTSTGPAFDLDNQSRRGPLDGQPDRGADEFWLLVSLSTATIAGPAVATAEQPVAFTAVISPADATPNISYFWQPSPAAGQWTAAPTFVFPAEGVYRLQVTALNAGAPASGEFSVSVLPNVRYFYLPLVAKR